MKLLPLLALAPLAAPAAPAAPVPHAYHLGPIRVPGLRAEPLGGGGFAIYGTMLNIGGRGDALVAVSSPVGAARIVRARPDPSLRRGSTCRPAAR